MNYKKLVRQAGYKADQANYLARKLEEKQVPSGKLLELSNYFPRTATLAGVEIGALSQALHDGFAEMNKPKPVKRTSDKDKKDGNS